LKGNHQLESRMRESRLSGSEGGAILISRPYPYYESCLSDHLLCYLLLGLKARLLHPFMRGLILQRK
jgi:hypothetical protein